jgi:hypothetical protein
VGNLMAWPAGRLEASYGLTAGLSSMASPAGRPGHEGRWWPPKGHSHGGHAPLEGPLVYDAGYEEVSACMG